MTVRIKARSVVGSANADDPLGERAPSPPRPFEEIRAAIESIPSAEVTVEGGKVTVSLAPHPTALSIQCPDGDLALADMWLLGNEHIAIVVLEALVPMFGPIEIDIGGHKDLLEGTDSGATSRYHQHAQSNPKESATPAVPFQAYIQEDVAEPRRAEPRSWRASLTNPLVSVLALSLLGGGYWFYRQLAKRGTGGVCDTSSECRGGKCLPNNTFEVDVPRSNVVPTQDDHAPGPGICTEECTSASDCPDYMDCRSAVSRDGFKPFGTSVSVCAPKTLAE